MVYSIEEREYANRKQSVDENFKSLASTASSDHELESSDLLSGATKANGSECVVVVKESDPLARRRVLYLGAAIPSPDLNGIDSIQEPLTKRYPVNGEEHVCGIEAWLSIDENGMQIQFLDDPSVMLYYPIRSLVYCASVRYVKQSKSPSGSSTGCRFVSVEDPEADHADNAQNPPLFAVTLQRTRQSLAKECHCFVTKTKTAALELVKACVKAYYTTEATQDCSKVPLYFKIDNDGSAMKEIKKEIYIAPAVSQESVVNYASSPQGSGFFYKTDRVLINCWLLSEHHRNGNRPSSSDHSSSSRSSRPSDRQRSRSSRTSVSDSKPTLARSPGHSDKPLALQRNSPYTLIPDASRVQRVKDPKLGRDVYVRWLSNMPTIPEQISLTQAPAIDAPQSLTFDNPTEKPLAKEMNRLVLKSDSGDGLAPYGTKPLVTPTYPEENISKKKHRQQQSQGYEIIEDYFVDSPKPKQSKKKHRHRHGPYDQSFSSPSSIFIPLEYPASVYPQEHYPTHTVPHQEHPTRAYPSEQFSNSPFTYQDYPKPAYSQQQQQQQVPAVSFSQKELAKPIYNQQQQQQPQIFMFPLDQKDFVIPSFNNKLVPQKSFYAYPTIQPFTQGSNTNSSSPYWYFAM